MGVNIKDSINIFFLFYPNFFKIHKIIYSSKYNITLLGLQRERCNDNITIITKKRWVRMMLCWSKAFIYFQN